MIRKLASIQRIKKLEPISGADRIEKATVLGWNCIVKKGEFKENDLVIFIEIDSLIPKAIWSDFLWKDSDKKEKYRLKTCRMKGVVSQGLVLSLIQFERLFEGVNEGDDVTELLCIEKYEPYIPVQLQGEIKGQFPHFIPKTDEPRIQIISEILDIYKGKEFYISEKIDGTSVTFYIYDNEFNVCSRNINLKESEGNIYWKIAKKYDIENKLKSLNKNIAIQGEIWGNGVQGNKYKKDDVYFSCFNVYNIDEQKYLNYKEFISFCGDLQIDTVPILQTIQLNQNIDDLILASKGNSIVSDDKVLREGIVLRTIEESQFAGERASFKVINPDFLIKYEE